MENFNVNDNTGYLVIPRYFKTIPYRLDFSDTAQPYCSTTGAASKHISWTAAVIQVCYIIRFLDLFNPFIAIRTPYGVSCGITHLRICSSVCYSLLCVAAASVLILKRSQLHGASYYIG